MKHVEDGPRGSAERRCALCTRVPPVVIVVESSRAEGPRVRGLRADLLLLEQILKRRPRIIGLQRRRRGRFLLARHANLKQLARISFILLRDTLLHRLHALEPATGIEIRALFARMQFKSALRTLPLDAHSLQHVSALRTARHGPRPRQIHRLGAQRVVPLWRTALTFRRRLARRFSPRFSITILISRLTVFSHKASPSTDVLCSRPRQLASVRIGKTFSRGFTRIFTDKPHLFVIPCGARNLLMTAASVPSTYSRFLLPRCARASE
jgi:hypothetical protein